METEYALNAVNQGVTALGIKGMITHTHRRRCNQKLTVTSKSQPQMASSWPQKRNHHRL